VLHVVQCSTVALDLVLELIPHVVLLVCLAPFLMNVMDPAVTGTGSGFHILVVWLISAVDTLK
jgi:hypothetical protein